MAPRNNPVRNGPVPHRCWPLLNRRNLKKTKAAPLLFGGTAHRKAARIPVKAGSSSTSHPCCVFAFKNLSPAAEGAAVGFEAIGGFLFDIEVGLLPSLKASVQFHYRVTGV